MPRTLKEMVVVITGASSGIGKALAERLGRAQARLVLAARRVERLNELNQTLGARHLCVRCDVAQQQDCQDLIAAAIRQFGRIDTLVCNAGFGIYDRFDKLSPQQVRELLAVNFLGTTDCMAAAIEHLKKQECRDGWRGQIMIVSSAAARRGVPYIGVYSATKAAQLALAEALRVELVPNRIAVTSVHPVQTRTEFGSVARTKGSVQDVVSPRQHTADRVARAMIRAIRRPVPEVWPSLPMRVLLSLGTLLPGAVDGVMCHYRQQVETANIPRDGRASE